jgi:hypothetical protein
MVELILTVQANNDLVFCFIFQFCRLMSNGENNGKVKNIERKIYSLFFVHHTEQRTTA